LGEGFEAQSPITTPLDVPKTYVGQDFAGIAGPCVLVDAERSAPASEWTALMLNASRARAYYFVLARTCAWTGWKLNVIRVG